jgi:hypothetical protein
MSAEKNHNRDENKTPLHKDFVQKKCREQLNHKIYADNFCHLSFYEKFSRKIKTNRRISEIYSANFQKSYRDKHSLPVKKSDSAKITLKIKFFIDDYTHVSKLNLTDSEQQQTNASKEAQMAKKKKAKKKAAKKAKKKTTKKKKR